jgi:adenylate cyclase
MGHELWKNAMTQRSFGKYVGSEILDMILANPETGWLKGTRNEATILLADVRGFTAYAAKKAPEQVVEALNDYLETATSVITQFDGYVDKFIGDAVLGVFGVPVYRQDHVDRAARAALKLQQTLVDKSVHGNPLLSVVGISIHTGLVVAGNVGSQSKMEYTVIGDSVNMAARLNGFAGPGEVVISRQVKERLSEPVQIQDMGSRVVKGKSDPVEIYQIKSLEHVANALQTE